MKKTGGASSTHRTRNKRRPSYPTMSDTDPGSVTIRTDDGELETIKNVADVAEVTAGRLQVVLTDETSEFRSGSLFGGWGNWRMWFDCGGDEFEHHIGENPLTMPWGFIRFQSKCGFRDRGGSIKRLRRPEL